VTRIVEHLKLVAMETIPAVGCHMDEKDEKCE